MKIVVCIKQVPDSDDVKIDPVTKNLDRTDITGVINSFDKNAIEEALRIKEKHGGQVIAISMGPPQTMEALREAVAMGCDDAVLLSCREMGGADTLATGYVLSLAIEKIEDVDIVLFGRHAVDADTGQVGPIVADFLDYRQITYITEVDIEGDYVIASRLLDKGIEKVKVKLPVVMTATKELNTPRYATPIKIMRAFKKEIPTWTSVDLNCDSERTGIKGSPTIVRDIYEPEKSSDVFILEGSPGEMVRGLLDKLAGQKVL